MSESKFGGEKNLFPRGLRTQFYVIPPGASQPEWNNIALGTLLGKACFGITHDAEGKMEEQPFVFEMNPQIPQEYRSLVQKLEDEGVVIQKPQELSLLPYDEATLREMGV